MPHEPPPDPSPILDLIEAFRTSKIMFRLSASASLTAWRRRPQPLKHSPRDLGMNRDALGGS